MKLSVEQRLPAAPSTVLHVLTDEGFLAFAGRSAGVDIDETTVTRSAGGDVVTAVRRSVPSSTIPAQAQALVGSRLQIRHVEAWSKALEGEDGPRYGTIAAEIAGAPVHVTGNVRLVPAPGDGTRHSSDIWCGLIHEVEVRATMPLVGAIVEQTAAKVVRRALEELGDAARRWLAGER